ncbi:MAG TPA: 23S rRNA (adenine(2503)-C(2))-methyltransferase RlmN [candidate division WOR-3 bacterium]|uniref:Probable dual-specificity RNA methyltransferase RlmN n=1 Tax=candidate division WOR-3 bacterium TaxID=2052148 RepID=A0A7V5HNI9_UNCW3|nr:23S rRNA (adenine(2503)-C(2))-methyltransferase RlmN [candidate division WOR-3 bacterium]
MPEDKNLLSLDRIALRKYIRQLNEKDFRVDQILNWLWDKSENNIDNFSNIPKTLRNQLKEDFYIERIKLETAQHSSDGSIKFLFSLADGEKVESVYIPDGERKTVCVSSQVGCALGCLFCATGKLGFKRNLRFYEITELVRFIRDYVKERITNVVFMGMGEPFLNYDEVIRASRLLNDNYTFKIGARKITISTSGVIPGIYRLVEEKEQFKLAVSLNSAIQSKREYLMPIAKKYNLTDLKKAIMYYFNRKRRWVTFEYIQIPGLNDGNEDVKALEAFIEDIPCKINLIPYNPVPGSPFRAPTEDEIKKFHSRLLKLKYTVTLRKSRGRDIKGACGQLAYLKSKE